MFSNKNKRETLYHTALLLHKEKGKKKPISISRTSNKKFRKLIKEHQSIENIFYHFYPKTSEKDSINDVKNINKIFKTIEDITFEYQITTCNNESYPNRLRNYPDSSPILYYRGDISLASLPTMAVIGTRELYNPTIIKEGENILERLINGTKAKENTDNQGYCIVSGLAKGCDTLAHNYSINNNGKTIAVIGTPLDKYYPSENKKLQEKIATDHLLISQYPPGFRPYKGTGFVNRNYTVTCLSSEGVLVIEADDNSGTQHAIKHCIEQEKKLYVLKNNFNNQNEWVKKYGDNILIPDR